jgi:hypothetical protein
LIELRGYVFGCRLYTDSNQKEGQVIIAGSSDKIILMNDIDFKKMLGSVFVQ